MSDEIIIRDWTGRVLFRGNFKSKEVDIVLDTNRCDCADGCSKCDGTGYKGDFDVNWVDESDERNVYEYINY